MELEQRLKELEEISKKFESRMTVLEKQGESHEGELHIISDEMNRPGANGNLSLWDIKQRLN
jgi:hypothetical protein